MTLMKNIAVAFIICSCFVQIANAQTKFLSDIIITDFDSKYRNGYTAISFNYWRYDTCLYSKQMCRYNTSTAAWVKVNTNDGSIGYEFLQSNNSGYQSKNPMDTFKYIFVPQNINASQLVRKLLIKEKYIRTDTFELTAIDTLLFSNYSLIRKVFGKSESANQRLLKVYVLKSVDEFGSMMLHYWVERIGIIKLTDKKCWRYSFEMKDRRTKPIEKMFAGLTKIIKEKYKDPYWLSEPCGIE